MKKKLWEMGMAVLLLTGVFWLAREGAKMASATGQEENFVVVVDPGHGGSDPGKVGIHKEKEKDINLSIALKVKDELEKHKVKVIMTREKDQELADPDSSGKKVQDLKRRCKMIHEIQPDCVLSIHQNSYPEEYVNGAQVFYYENSAEGKKLGEILQEHLVEKLDKENHRKAKGNSTYYMLKKTDAVLVIVECGFLSNNKEALLLVKEDYQERIAEAICEGTMEYLSGEKEKKLLCTPCTATIQNPFQIVCGNGSLACMSRDFVTFVPKLLAG